MATTTTPRKGKPWIFVTWLTGLLAGKAQCEWAAWYRARFKYDKVQSDFDLAAWTTAHDALVLQRAREFEADGWKVQRENQNWVRVTGEHAVLVGKPDLIASQGGQFTIADGKSGDTNPKDWHQMLLYLYMVPMAWKRPTLRMTGEVFYVGHRIEIFPEEFTADLKSTAFALVRRIAGPEPLKRVPSIPECTRCDIADCPDRMTDTESTSPITTEF